MSVRLQDLEEKIEAKGYMVGGQVLTINESNKLLVDGANVLERQLRDEQTKNRRSKTKLRIRNRVIVMTIGHRLSPLDKGGRRIVRQRRPRPQGVVVSPITRLGRLPPIYRGFAGSLQRRASHQRLPRHSSAASDPRLNRHLAFATVPLHVVG